MLNTPPKPSTLKARAVAPWECELPSFYRVHPCGSQNVTDALRDEISYWEPRNPIFISAPTGRGKSHFFKTVLLPDALARNRTMLIIGNRIALSMQQKMELLELLDSPLRSYLTDEGLRNTECFGSVAVITYHRLPAFLSNPENAVFLSKLLYVASDEVHLLTTDSAFNSNTDYYLKLLTTRFQSAIRVYLTATPSDVLYPLAQAEHENWGRKEVFVNYYLPPRSFQLYRFDASYAHIRLDFVQRLEDLKCQIDASSEEKWLVFCDSKESGRAFADSLNVSHQYLDADSKSSAEWTALLKNQRFDCRVMVCTKAIDTGINIHDPKLKHVAVVTDDHTTFLQMIGRKRCAPGESYTVHVVELSGKKLGVRAQRAKELLELLEEYETSDAAAQRSMAARFWNAEDTQTRTYFHLIGGKLYPNDLAFHKLRRQYRFYEQLQNNEITFADAVRGWLGKKPERSAEQSLKELQTFCQAHVDSALEEDTFQLLRDLVIKAVSGSGFYEDHPERLPEMGPEGVNHRLNYLNLPYQVKKCRKNLWLRANAEAPEES